MWWCLSRCDFCVNFNHEVDQLSAGPKRTLPVEFLKAGPPPCSVGQPETGLAAVQEPGSLLKADVKCFPQNFSLSVWNLQMMLLVLSLFWKNFDRLND